VFAVIRVLRCAPADAWRSAPCVTERSEMTKWTDGGDYFVEVWFPVEPDHDGYPKNVRWEQLLGRPIAEDVNVFRLDSVPYYLRDVSLGDVVRAGVRADCEISNAYVFETVVERGGHNTYRLLLKALRDGDPDATVDELVERGLAVEIQYGDFIAVDVPPTVDQEAIDDYLVGESDAGRWALQYACIQTPEFKADRSE
jgi:uncharacterized protein DUF4265